MPDSTSSQRGQTGVILGTEVMVEGQETEVSCLSRTFIFKFACKRVSEGKGFVPDAQVVGAANVSFTLMPGFSRASGEPNPSYIATGMFLRFLLLRHGEATVLCV